MRQKLSLELKVEALGLLKTGLSISSVSKQLKIPTGVLQTWSQIYAKEGVKGLAAYPKNICSGEIKDRTPPRECVVPLFRGAPGNTCCLCSLFL